VLFPFQRAGGASQVTCMGALQEEWMKP
jgi:hypothetical protein